MKKKVVVFSQIDLEILEKLQEKYQVSIINPKYGDVNAQILKEV